MDSFFVINYYRHQIYYLAFIIVTNSVLLIFSTFLKNKDYKTTYNIIYDFTGNNYSFIWIICSFILLSIILSYTRVKSKVLMYFNYISPYKIIYYYGLIGAILTLIGLISVSFIPFNNNQYCPVKDISDKNNVTYYDNYIIYYKELKNKYNNDLYYEFFSELLLVTPLFLILSFLEFTCEILTIYYLNPNYVLIRENLYYFVIRLIFFLTKLNDNEYAEYITLNQFLIVETTEIIALLGYLAYFEIIELNCCKLDKDLRRNIIKRGERESIISSQDNNDENDNTSSSDSFTDENNKDSKSEDEIEIG